jgi:DNA adenine methylase
MNSPLKWMGGKKKLLPFIEKHIPEYNTYIEPFMGSAAVFFSQEPENSICSDIQSEPIDVLNAIKEKPEGFYALFDEYAKQLWESGSDYYYHMRDEYNNNKQKFYYVKRAAMFMILSRAGFNGLIRFNSKGSWNVPFGDRGNHDSKEQATILTSFLSIDKILSWSDFLNTGNKRFYNQSFSESIQAAQKGDFIYCDPPYLITTQQYNEWTQDHETQLANDLRDADSRGVKFILSNVYRYKGEENQALLDLYSGFNYELKNHKYIVGPNQTRRQSVEEIIIFNA